MTCIVGLVDKGRVFMGGDSAAGGGQSCRPIAEPKVFQLGEYLIGYTTSFRMGQLLQMMKPPRAGAKVDPYRFMVTTFAEKVRALLTKHGFAKISSNVEEGGTFLIGFRGRLFCIQEDYSVLAYEDHYHAVGCGVYYALGSLASTEGLEPTARVKRALKAAGKFSAFVCKPYYVLEG